MPYTQQSQIDTVNNPMTVSQYAQGNINTVLANNGDFICTESFINITTENGELLTTEG